MKRNHDCEMLENSSRGRALAGQLVSLRRALENGQKNLDDLVRIFAKLTMNDDYEQHPLKENSATVQKQCSPLDLFSEELVNLLQSQPEQKIGFCEFSGCYQRHFGKQFKLANYGHVKLKNLFKAIPHIVKIMPNATVALSSTQSQDNDNEMNREERMDLFGREVATLLKLQPECKIVMNEFSTRYARHFGKLFTVEDFGNEKVMSMLKALPHLIHIEDTKPHATIILLSQKSHSFAQKCMEVRDKGESIAEFAQECVELMMTTENGSMPFRDFDQRYFEHFERQCRASDYGFDFLTDLFRAIPGTVKIIEDKGSRYVPSHLKRGLGMIMVQLTESAALSGMDFPELCNEMSDSLEVIDVEE